jgi:hypothetical protein
MNGKRIGMIFSYKAIRETATGAGLRGSGRNGGGCPDMLFPAPVPDAGAEHHPEKDGCKCDKTDEKIIHDFTP